MEDWKYTYYYNQALTNQLNFRFGLVSLFNGISTFVGYSMPKPFS